MKVAGGLNYVAGPMGAGKTLYAVRRIVNHLCEGQYVVTNVQLGTWRGGTFHPGVGWAERIARHVAITGTHKRRRRVADSLRSRYIYEAELGEARRYRLPGRGEARGLFMWDETHNDLNNRSWRDDARGEVLEWATQLRKLGFVGFLLSQSVDNTDAQLRRICNYALRLQNQREQTRLLGVRVTPWPLFLAAWYPAHVPIRSVGAQHPVKVERYFLGWHRQLYDTLDLYHGLDAPDDVNGLIHLPAGGRPLAPARGAPAEAAPSSAPEPSIGRVLGGPDMRNPAVAGGVSRNLELMQAARGYVEQ